MSSRTGSTAAGCRRCRPRSIFDNTGSFVSATLPPHVLLPSSFSDAVSRRRGAASVGPARQTACRPPGDGRLFCHAAGDDSRVVGSGGLCPDGVESAGGRLAALIASGALRLAACAILDAAAPDTGGISTGRRLHQFRVLRLSRGAGDVRQRGARAGDSVRPGANHAYAHGVLRAGAVAWHGRAVGPVVAAADALGAAVLGVDRRPGAQGRRVPSALVAAYDLDAGASCDDTACESRARPLDQFCRVAADLDAGLPGGGGADARRAVVGMARRLAAESYGAGTGGGDSDRRDAVGGHGGDLCLGDRSG